MGFSRCGTHGLGVGVLLTRTGGIVTSSKLCAKLYVGLAMWSVSCSVENLARSSWGQLGQTPELLHPICPSASVGLLTLHLSSRTWPKAQKLSHILHDLHHATNVGLAQSEARPLYCLVICSRRFDGAFPDSGPSPGSEPSRSVKTTGEPSPLSEITAHSSPARGPYSPVTMVPPGLCRWQNPISSSGWAGRKRTLSGPCATS